MEQTSKDRLLTWALLLVVAATVFFWGLFLYFSIGDRGRPDRDFGALEDVPGESPYSTRNE